MVLLTHRFDFCASHRLHNPDLSERENDALYGKCNNPNGHGHNYQLEVTLAGEPDPGTGMVLELSILKRIVDEEICERYDHKNLNLDVSDFKERIPTAENMLLVIWERLTGRIPRGKLHRLRLIETANNSFEYFGPPKNPGSGQ
ncbi:MAG: 6-carboxytetrahydropterin synthase [Deltaproteobacteria bacterium]|nr:6-carboxytetrahydropterin synthase [Deltaproteobacteria bacterium]